MIHNEMSFLFGVVPTPGKPADNVMSAVNNNNHNNGDIFGTIDTTRYDRIYKSKSKTGKNNGVISEVQNTIYAQERMTKDPYVALLDYFSDMGKGPISMRLQAADFVYLKDLGVFPINRLIILRRYKDGVVVPNNLSLFKEKPISTVIGWVKFDEANKEMFSFNFNEKWVETSDTLDKVIQKIMKEQFGIRTEMFMPVPAWSQGFLFGMLDKMKLTSDYSATNVPTGDPNVLRTSMMREVESQSLMSDLKITFETAYEQKYIDGIDPGLAFQDIIANLVRCGTSEMKFVLKSGSEFIQNIMSASQMRGGDTVNAWLKVGTTLIDAFMSAVGEFFTDASGQFQQYQKVLSDGLTVESTSGKKFYKTEKVNDQGKTLYTDDYNKWYYIEKGIYKVTKEPKEGIKGIKTLADRSSENNVAEKLYTSTFTGAMGTFVQTLLAGSVYRYRWPLIGSIGVMTGLATTPWHLTVGNPFSPILNMANIVVNNVDLKFSNEMGFNDMPKRVEAIIDIKMSRPLGSSEINRMFNNQYGRIYSKLETPSPSTKPSDVKPVDEVEVKSKTSTTSTTSTTKKTGTSEETKKAKAEQLIKEQSQAVNINFKVKPGEFLPNGGKPWGMK